MIGFLLFFVICVTYNEAHNYFKDDLDFASVSGRFIPVESLDIQDSDALSARSTNNFFQDGILTIEALATAIQNWKSDKIQLYDNCTLEIKKSRNSFEMTAGNECNGMIDIGNVIRKFFENFNIDVLSSGFIQSNKLLFQSLKVNETYVIIHAGYNGDYSHTQSMLKLTDIDLKLGIPRNQKKKPSQTPSASTAASSDAETNKSFSFEMKSKFNNLDTEIFYNVAESPIAKIGIAVKETTVKEFLKSWSLGFTELKESGLSTETFENAKISGHVTGRYNTSNNHFQLFAQFKYKKDPLDLTVNLILDKPKGLPIAVALVVQLNNVNNIVEYLKTLVGYKGPDFIKDLVQSCIFSVSNTTIDLIDSDGFLKLAGKDQESVLPGINIFIETDIKGVLSKCDKTVQAGTKQELVNITLTKTGVTIKLPVGFSADLSIVMKCFLQKTTQYAVNEIPTLLKEKNREPSFFIKELSYENEVFKISVSYTGDISIPFLGVNISNPTFAVSINKSEAKTWIFEGQADIISNLLEDASNKGKIDFTLDTDQNIKVSIKVPALEVQSLAKFFGVDPFEGDIKYLKRYLNPAIKDLYIDGKLNIKDRTGELTVTASPVINGMTGLTVAIFIWQPKKEQLSIAFGLVMKNMRLDKALKKFAGVEMPDSWLNDVSIVMLASNGDKMYCNEENAKRPECQKSTKTKKNAETPSNSGTKDNSHKTTHVSNRVIKKSTSKQNKPKVISKLNETTTHFDTIDELRDFKIEKGLVLEASIEPKAEHCNGNGICEFLVDKKVKKLFLKGKLTTSSVKIEAGISGDIKLGGDVTLKSASLVLEFGSENNKVSIKCEFHTANPQLKIAGFIEIDLSGKLKIGGTMSGMIHEPFGIKWLSFGNLMLSFGLDLKTALPSIEMGAEIWLGNINSTGSQDLFKFQGYFGFDATSPKQCFFYARSFGADLTIDNILKALGSTEELPKMVAESGFKGELKVSLNLYPQEKVIEEFGFSIPPGFVFKGKISILGYHIECDLRFNHLEKTFFLNANFDPIDDWGSGMIKLYRSADNHTEGPVLYLDIQPNNFEVCIKGYINILGVGSLINIEITSSAFSFEVSGNLWGVLTMSVKVKADYANKKLNSFSFEGCVGANIKDLVSKSAIEAIEAAQEKAKVVFSKAIETLEKAKLDVENVRNKINKWKQGIQEYKKKLEKRKEDLKKETESMQANCGKECGTVCIPFFGWVSHCTTIWGHPVGCLRWDNCKWKAPNLICIAACEIRKGLAKFAAWAEQLGIKIMLGLASVGELLGDAASELTKIADGIISVASGLVEFARDATDEILKFTISLLNIEIDYLCLNAEFNPQSKTCVGFGLAGKFLGTTSFSFNGTICIDLSTFKTLGSTTAKSAEPKIEKLEDNTASIDAKAKDVDRACKQMEKNASRIENEVKSTTTAKLEKRSYVYTEEELRFHKLVYDPLPYVNLRSEETNIAMTRAVPWESLNVEEFGKSTKDAAFTRHQIPNEESHDACHQHQNVLSRYSTIANGFSSAIEHLNDAKEGFMYQKRSYLNQIDYLNGLIRSGPLNNMTLDEQEDLWHWKDYAEDHIKSYLDKATSVFQGKKRDSINHVRQALNDVIKSDRGLKLPEYIKYLHSLAVKADKKSQVNQKPTKDSTSSWHHIKKILLNVATDDNIPTFELAKEIGKVQKMLSAMKRSSIPCAA